MPHLFRAFLFLLLFLPTLPASAQTEAQAAEDVLVLRARDGSTLTETIRIGDRIRASAVLEHQPNWTQGKVTAIGDSSLTLKRGRTQTKLDLHSTKLLSTENRQRARSAAILLYASAIVLAIGAIFVLLLLPAGPSSIAYLFAAIIGANTGIVATPLAFIGAVLHWSRWRRVNLEDWVYKKRQVLRARKRR